MGAVGIVRSGLDRLAAGEGPDLGGRPVSVLCHPASITADFVHVREVLQRRGASIVSLLGPEHGLDAAAQDMETVASNGAGGDRGPAVYSLYGASEHSLVPAADMFHGAELLLIDLQDVGSRYYTYVWTMVLAAEVALAERRTVWLLDRPNPLGGLDDWVEGGSIEPGQESFVGLHPVPTRHGLTAGELVRLALQERGRVSTQGLHVLACDGWRRSMTFMDTGLPWVLPSPNMPGVPTAWVYPGQCLLEGTNVSEGRGTTRPFEIFGAPWVDGRALVEALQPGDIPGLALRPLTFKPMFHKHATVACGGLQLHVREPRSVRSVTTGWALLRALWRLGKGAFQWRTEPYEFVADRPAIDLLAGGPWLREAVEAGSSIREMHACCEPERRAFLHRRRPFLIYD